MENKTNHALGFVVTIGVSSVPVLVLFGYQSVLLGLGLLLVATLLLSVEPFTTAVMVLVALLVSAYMLSPITAFAAALILLVALIYALAILTLRSRTNAKQASRYRLK